MAKEKREQERLNEREKLIHEKIEIAKKYFIFVIIINLFNGFNSVRSGIFHSFLISAPK